jgi:hypothetical protein
MARSGVTSTAVTGVVVTPVTPGGMSDRPHTTCEGYSCTFVLWCKFHAWLKMHIVQQQMSPLDHLNLESDKGSGSEFLE